MWSIFGRPSQGEEDHNWRGPHRVHVDQPAAGEIFRQHLDGLIRRLYNPGRRLAVVCIGTDRSTGDCLGPLIGTKLSAILPGHATVLGTLDQPVHAVNLEEALENLRSQAPDPFVIAVDACLGRTESVGYVSLRDGPLQPGTGVNKNLPPVGDMHIIGIVNVGGFMEYLVLQNTRLSLVMHMAEIVAQGLAEVIGNLPLPSPDEAARQPDLATAEVAAGLPGI